MIKKLKESIDKRFSTNTRKRNKKKEVKNVTRKPVEDWFPVSEFEKNYISTVKNMQSYAIKIEFTTSNFISDIELERMAIRLTERFSNIDVPYSFISLVKAKDTSAYTNWIQSKMDDTNDLYQKVGLHNLRNYVNKKSASGNYNDRDFYLIFSCYEDEREEFEILLKQIKTDIGMAAIKVSDVAGQQLVDIMYSYLNPDVNTSMVINDYTKFVISDGKGVS